MEQSLNRRDVIHGGLLLGAGLILSGCQSGGGTSSARLPGPVWPDMEPAPAPPSTPSEPSQGPIRPLPATGAVAVIPRASWTGAQPIVALADPMNGIDKITVHHDAINSLDLRSPSDSMRRLESIRRSHVSQRWADIGYHYIIDPSGRVWEGRPLRLQGAHVKDRNEHNMGVMVMGNFNEQTPTPQAINTLDAFVAMQMRRYNIPVSRVYTHQELGKSACPGRNLQRYMDMTRGRGRLARA